MNDVRVRVSWYESTCPLPCLLYCYIVNNRGLGINRNPFNWKNVRRQSTFLSLPDPPRRLSYRETFHMVRNVPIGHGKYIFGSRIFVTNRVTFVTNFHQDVFTFLSSPDGITWLLERLYIQQVRCRLQLPFRIMDRGRKGRLDCWPEKHCNCWNTV